MEEENYILKIVLYIKDNLSTDKFHHKMEFIFMRMDLVKEEEFNMEK
jgi:BMFP domain-containing protein YqiC